MIEVYRREFEGEKHLYNPRVEEIERMINTTEDSLELANLNNELLFLKNLVKPGIEMRLPDLTIDKEIVLHGSKRSLKLIPYDKAHSAGDIVAYLPQDKVCFMGDLLFAKSHTWFGSGDPEKLISALEEILQFDVKYFVPGHGPLSSKEDVLLQIQYINEVINLVDTKKKLEVKDYHVEELSSVFKEWKGLCFSWNIKYLIKRIQIMKIQEQ